jgi:hypothetical protein
LWLQKKVQQQIFFSPLSFVAVFGSGIRDKHPRSATLLDLVIICLKILIAACVFVQEKSVACSTAAALAWDASFSQLVDPSGRAVAGVHVQAYNNGDSAP